MACRLVGARPLSEPMLEYCWLDFNQNFNIFIEENAFESVVCEMVATLSRPKCVKGQEMSRVMLAYQCDLRLFHWNWHKCQQIVIFTHF